MSVNAERIYDFLERDKKKNEYVVLVDRVWPRGIKKASLNMDDWAKSLAPSKELRKWFNHDPERWSEFKSRYRSELKDHQDKIQELHEVAGKQPVTLLYRAKDREHNQAVVLVDVIERGKP